MSKRTKTTTTLDPQLEALANSIKTPEELEELTRLLHRKNHGVRLVDSLTLTLK